jgi:hypothetical protein
MTVARRSLTFASLDGIMPDIDLLLRGHTTVGNWSLGQICNHLCKSVNFTLDGFPVRAPWLIRKTVGPLLLRHILRTGRFFARIKAPAAFQPAPRSDARAEADALRAALRRFAAHSGPLAEHPLAGRVSRSVWEQFHCIHCAHHLSFALPVGTDEASSAGKPN